MKSENEIRIRRDQLREILTLPDPDFDDEDQQTQHQAQTFFMRSHEMLLSWVLNEDDRVDIPFRSVEDSLKENES